MPQNPPQIFIAHANEDKPLVRELYAKLVEAGYKPWFDEEDLLPGQNWREEIPKALKNSDMFIACLSSTSISKRGYIQREFKMAMEMLAELPPGEIYLIPLKFIDLKLDPSYFKGDELPVDSVTWDECVEFCQRLSKLTGRDYRLPSEAEWEYACRGGTTTPFYFGETITTDLANYRGTDFEYQGQVYLGTYADESQGIHRKETTPVGQFPPNAFGLYDLHGNVREWCADDYHKNYENAPRDGSIWISPDDNTAKTLRGGCWSILPFNCRCAGRDSLNPVNSGQYLGFRVVCDLGDNVTGNKTVNNYYASPQKSTANDGNAEALALWTEKLAAYRREEAIASDPEKKFQLKQLIKECQQKIGELGG